MHCGEIVEDGLQLVLLDAVADHDELLQEEQDVGADSEDVLVSWPGTFWKRLEQSNEKGRWSILWKSLRNLSGSHASITAEFIDFQVESTRS